MSTFREKNKFLDIYHYFFYVWLKYNIFYLSVYLDYRYKYILNVLSEIIVDTREDCGKKENNNINYI